MEAGQAASSSEDGGLPFRNTQLFQIVMKALSTFDNSSVASTGFDVDDGSENFAYRKESKLVIIITVGVFFAILTSLGNLMVMISFKIDKQLQTISNYFLFSLAVADIAIGTISIPLMTYYIAVDNTWGIGYTMCQFWLCVDYLMSNASVLNLLLISFDRYFSVTRPLSYRPRRTTKKALTMIACTYIISVILWPPWIISWPYIEGKFTVKPDKCVVQFLETNPYVTVGTAIAAFYLPVTIMIILYTRVYWETQKRQKEFGRLQASQFQAKSIRREVSSNSIVKSSERGSLRKPAWSFSLKSASQARKRSSWLKSCTGRSQTSSEDSSEQILRIQISPSLRRPLQIPIRASNRSSQITLPDGEKSLASPRAAVVNIDDTSMSSSLYTSKKKNPSPPNSPQPPNDDTISAETQVETSPRNGSTRFRSRGDKPDRPVLDTYTVLIELKDEGRPSVRLSTCESPINEEGGLLNHEARSRSKSDFSGDGSELAKRQVSLKEKESPAKNGRGAKSFNANDRKSEKERKKKERKQESKAAKTLSAILFAFIITWTPYNLIVCYEAFVPNSVPEILFTISYCLCYINSTINPLCYALCNARFRHTYKRILRCKWKAERPNINRNAYVRRQ